MTVASGRATVEGMSDRAYWGVGASALLAVDDTGDSVELDPGEYVVVWKGDSGCWFLVTDAAGEADNAGAGASHWMGPGASINLTIGAAPLNYLAAKCDTGETCTLVIMQPNTPPVAS